MGSYRRLERMTINVQTFLHMHPLLFASLRKRCPEREGACLLTLKEEAEVDHPVFSCDGRMYDVRSLHTWLQLQKQECVTRNDFFVIQGCPIRTLTLYSTSSFDVIHEACAVAFKYLHSAFLKTKQKCAFHKLRTELETATQILDERLKTKSTFERLQDFHKQHVANQQRKVDHSYRGFNGGGEGSAFSKPRMMKKDMRLKKWGYR